MLHISGVISITRNTKSAVPGEVSYHFVFRADDGTRYVLHVDDQTTPATIDVQVGVEIKNYYMGLLRAPPTHPFFFRVIYETTQGINTESIQL